MDESLSAPAAPSPAQVSAVFERRVAALRGRAEMSEAAPHADATAARVVLIDVGGAEPANWTVQLSVAGAPLDGRQLTAVAALDREMLQAVISALVLAREKWDRVRKARETPAPQPRCPRARRRRGKHDRPPFGPHGAGSRT